MAARTFDEPTFGGTEHFDYVPGQIVVRVNDSAVRPFLSDEGTTVASARSLPDSVTEPLEYLRREAGAHLARPLLASDAQVRALSRFTTSGGRALPIGERQRLAVVSSVADSPTDDLAGLTIVELPASEISARLLRRIAASPAIEFAEHVPARWLLRHQPSEPTQNRQWGLRAIRWYECNQPRASNVTVAVLDTGVDDEHPDLKSLAISYDRQGLSRRDIVGHGTHVCGIISATTNNPVGINGVAHCTLAVYKVFPDEPAADGQFYVDGDRYLKALGGVVGSGAKVINLSIGGSARSDTEQLLFDRLEPKASPLSPRWATNTPRATRPNTRLPTRTSLLSERRPRLI
jgi:hypothetical protein